MIINQYKVAIGNGVVVNVEEHPKGEFPQYYPEETVLLGNMLALLRVHSKHYQPTQEARVQLAQKIRSADSWCYLMPVQEKVRAS